MYDNTDNNGTVRCSFLWENTRRSKKLLLVQVSIFVMNVLIYVKEIIDEEFFMMKQSEN